MASPTAANMADKLADMYLDYLNNYGTTEYFAATHCIHWETMRPLIEAGRALHELRAANGGAFPEAE